MAMMSAGATAVDTSALTAIVLGVPLFVGDHFTKNELQSAI